MNNERRGTEGEHQDRNMNVVVVEFFVVVVFSSPFQHKSMARNERKHIEWMDKWMKANMFVWFASSYVAIC